MVIAIPSKVEIIRMRTRAMWLGAGLVLAATAQISPAANPPQPLTVRDAIETRRPLFADNAVAVSPDGTRFAVLLLRGDVDRNGVHGELIAGELKSLASAARVRVVARLFASGLARVGKHSVTLGSWNRFIWIDSESVAFLWDDDRDITQIVSTNLRTGRTKFLTSHESDVQTFDVAPSGIAIFSARNDTALEQSRKLWKSGFAVTNGDAFSLLVGRVNDQPWGDFKQYVSPAGGAVSKPLTLLNGDVDRENLKILRISPDGQYAILDSPPAAPPDSWARYTDPWIRRNLQRSQRPDTKQSSYIRQLFLVDLQRARGRPLWNAPTLRWKSGAFWAPDSRSVLLAPAFLPPDVADPAALNGEAAVEVDVRTGDVQRLPIPTNAGGAKPFSVTGWAADGAVTLSDGRERLVYRKASYGWHLVSRDVEGQSGRRVEMDQSGVRVEIREDMNTPPKLFAIDTVSGEEQMIFDLNPGLLKRFRIGRAEKFDWKDREGRSWHGRLYYPVDYRDDHRYPLVIQTHGVAPDSKFSLTGLGDDARPALGPGVSIFAAQVLAGRNIAVLQMEDKKGKDATGFDSSPAEPQIYSEAYKAAVAELEGKGLIDPTRVGLAGFSRTGWHVEYALTQSKFPYAAALVSDNLHGSYMEASLAGLGSGGIDAESKQFLGAPGYGDGLRIWLERAPAFNADKVRTPLRMQAEAGLYAILPAWEMFNALRIQKKPVEYVIIPEIEKGGHLIQNPRQCLASQAGAVDWFDFWLNGREVRDPEDTAQYTRWRELRDAHIQVLQTSEPNGS